MKKSTLGVLLAVLCLPGTSTLHAQWLGGASHIFDIAHSPDAHQPVNALVDWAGVNAYPWSSAPTESAWITRTSDGGATWRFSQIPGAEGFACWGLSALDADHAWASLNYRANRFKSRLYRTQDGGNTWQLQYEGFPAGFQVHFFDTQTGILLRGNRYTRTTDGGATWTPVDTLPAANLGVFSVATEFFDVYRDTVWWPTIDGKISRSTDRGLTWQTFSTALADAGVAANMLDFADGRNGLALAAFQTTLDPATNLYYGLDPPRLFATSDGGVTWVEVPYQNLPFPPVSDYSFISSIGAVPGLQKTFVLTAYSYTNGYTTYTANQYLSSDGGFTWTLLAPNPASFALQSLEFVSPTQGWGGVGGDYADRPFFFRWDGALVGTQEPSTTDLNIQVWPNPASEALSVTPNLPQSSLLVYDAQGRLWLRTPQQGVSTTLDVSQLPEGVYVAAVLDASGQVVGIKRWVKAARN